jgi:hypothetical protein
MQTIDYNTADFEKLALSAVESKAEFLVKVTGWKRKLIASGLSHYRCYREGQGRAMHALMVIPYGFITPTFWSVCVRAEFEHFMPSWEMEKKELLIKFTRPV